MRECVPLLHPHSTELTTRAAEWVQQGGDSFPYLNRLQREKNGARADTGGTRAVFFARASCRPDAGVGADRGGWAGGDGAHTILRGSEEEVETGDEDEVLDCAFNEARRTRRQPVQVHQGAVGIARAGMHG
jgi:hypothetical protein